MNRTIVFISALLVLSLVVVGCSTGPYGRRSASLESRNGQATYSDNYVGFLMPTVNPEELANAQLTQALAEQIKKGNPGDLAGKYIGCLVNQDESRTVVLHHPSQSSQIKIRPGNHAFIYTTHIPEYLHVRWYGDEDMDRVRAVKKSKIYNGLKTDFGNRIWYDE